MKSYLIAERYAKGLNASIVDEEQLEPVLAALRTLREMFEENRDFRSALSNPSVNAKSRLAVLKDILAAEEISGSAADLAALLLRRGRITLLPDVTAVFSTLVDERLNRVGAVVTTAVELDDARRERLGAALEQYSKKTIRMECGVDPELLGGAVARIGSIVIDGSVRSRLERLRAALLSEEQ